MNLVICRHHDNNGYYLFRVPDGVELDVDTLVTVETARGEQPAVCATGTFRADPAIIGKHWGGQNRKIKRVMKILREFVLEWPGEPQDEGSELE